MALVQTKSEYHGKVISYDDIPSIKGRASYLDQSIISKVNTSVYDKAPVYFHPVDYDEINAKEDSNGNSTTEQYARSYYRLCLHGILECGRKASVVIQGVRPYIEVLVPKGKSVAACEEHIMQILSGLKSGCKKNYSYRLKRDVNLFVSVTTGFYFKGFRDKEDKFLKIEFLSNNPRKAAIKKLTERRYTVTHDDLANYYRVILRDYRKKITRWNLLSKYKYCKYDKFKERVFVVDITNFETIEDADIPDKPHFVRPNFVTCCWDIETYKENMSDGVPLPKHDDANIFDIGMSFLFRDTRSKHIKEKNGSLPDIPGELLRVAIVDFPHVKPMDNKIIISCKNEQEIISAFAKLWSKFTPEFCIGFNDSEYDWAWLVKRANKYSGLRELKQHMCVFKLGEKDPDQVGYKNLKRVTPDGETKDIDYFNYRRYQVKKDADTNIYGSTLQYSGYINLDVRTLFRCIDNKAAKSSLNYFLSTNNLASKKDMPYQLMFKVYEASRLLMEKNICIKNVDDHDTDSHNIITTFNDIINDNKKLLYSSDETIDIWKKFSKLVFASDYHYKLVLGEIVVKGPNGKPRTNYDRIRREYEETFEACPLTYENVYECRKIIGYLYGEVVEYCNIDALKCHQLMEQRNVYNDKIAVSDCSYTSVFDAFYRADVAKLKNMLISNGQVRSNLKFKNASKPPVNSTYPGAYVFDPETGLKTSKQSILESLAVCLAHERHELTDEQLTQDAVKYALKWKNVTKEQVKNCHDFIRKNGIHYKDMDESDQSVVRVGVGANVFPHVFMEFLTINNFYPIAGLDFSSLYPSIIMAYNLSTEYMVGDREQAIALKRQGYNLALVKFPMEGVMQVGWSVRHDNKIHKQIPVLDSSGNAVVDESGKVVMTSPDFADRSQYMFGLYAHELRDLKADRSAIKKRMKPHKKFLEDAKQRPDYAEFVNTEEYQYHQFMFTNLDALQKVRKIFMNTLYGMTGTTISEWYNPLICGGITLYGQKNIRFAESVVKKYGWGVKYGDTDSIYITPPRHVFKDLDCKYYSGDMEKEPYWKALVEVMFVEIEKIKDIVNDALEKNNGTKFLKMAYEEVLWPCIFSAKKKYAGIPHEEKIAFNIVNPENDLFIRGFDCIKRGVSPIMKNNFLELLTEMFSVDNIKTPRDLVNERIKYMYAQKYEIDQFISTDVYKPEKQNVKVQTFYKRMVERNEYLPAPLERFPTVIVEKYPFKFDIRGRKSRLSIGERMEYPEYAEKHGLKIDLDYYMENSVKGQFARLLSYMPELIDNTNEDKKKCNEKTYDNCKRYVNDIIRQYSSNYFDKGEVLKNVFNKVKRGIKHMYKEKHISSAFLGNTDIKREKKEHSEYMLENIEYIRKKAETQALKHSKQYLDFYIGNKMMKSGDLMKIKKMYQQRKHMVDSKFKKEYIDCFDALSGHIAAIIHLYKCRDMLYERNITRICEKLDLIDGYTTPDIEIEEYTIEGILDEIDSEDLDITNEEVNGLIELETKLKHVYQDLVSCYTYKHNFYLVLKYIKNKYDKEKDICELPVTKKEIRDEASEFLAGCSLNL